MNQSLKLTVVKSPAITEIDVASFAEISSATRAHIQSIAVVDDNPERRNSVAKALDDLRVQAYHPKVFSLPWVGNPRMLVDQEFNVVLVSVDCDWDAALGTIDVLSRDGSVTPIAYSQAPNDDLLIRCMRSGVREFLKFPFAPGTIEEAFNRIAGRQALKPETTNVTGKSFVFLGAKGGCGVTTAACNFAVSLAKESKGSTLLIDLDLPLGNVGLNLGVSNEFSTLDALKSAERMDTTFLMDLVVRHSSGLHVLLAPGNLTRVPPADETIDTLIKVAAQAFDYVVVDAGSRLDLADTGMFEAASTIYLVTQVGITELRNANRVIVGVMQPYLDKLEVVLNRYTSGTLEIGDDAIEKALTRPALWRIPNDYETVRSMQNTATPFALKDSKIQRAVQKMAKKASGVAEEKAAEKKKSGFFSFRPRFAAKTDLKTA